jgi:hypothetical protein
MYSQRRLSMASAAGLEPVELEDPDQPGSQDRNLSI